MFKPLSLSLALLLSASAVCAQSNFRRVEPPKTNIAKPGDSKEGLTATAVPNPEIKRLYKEAVKYADAGLYRQAAETFQLALNMAPTYADAYYGLGQAYYDQQHWRKAIRSLERALELNPKDQNTRDLLNRAHVMLEKPRSTPPVAPVQGKGELVALKAEDSAKSLTPTTTKSPGPTTTRSPAPMTTKSSALTTKSPGPTTTKSPEPTTTKSPGPTTTKSPEPTTTKSPEPTTTKSNISPNELKLTKMYRVGPNDVLDIRFNNSSSPESTLFTITPSGFLEYPVLVEPVQVNGLAVEEIAAKIEAELTRRALADNPKVQVGVRDYASHTILISGLVKDSGTKILRREAVPLYVVLADAQPLPEASSATIIRNDSNETFDINLASSTDMNLLVRPGDVITLQPNEEQFLYVGGAVKSPGERVYRRGLTLMQVILAAGGFSSKAKEVRLGRDDGKGFLVTNRYKLKDIDEGKERDPLVRPGDRIMVIE